MGFLLYLEEEDFLVEKNNSNNIGVVCSKELALSYDIYGPKLFEYQTAITIMDILVIVEGTVQPTGSIVLKENHNTNNIAEDLFNEKSYAFDIFANVCSKICELDNNFNVLAE